MDYPHLLKAIRDLEVKRDSLLKSLVLSPVSSYEDYRERVGRWASLNEALIELRRVLEGEEDE